MNKSRFTESQIAAILKEGEAGVAIAGNHAPRHAQKLGKTTQVLLEMRQWSQEILSDISGLGVRAVQRVETGESSCIDTRRALARAFDAEDIDVFNKPCACRHRRRCRPRRRSSSASI